MRVYLRKNGIKLALILLVLVITLLGVSHFMAGRAGPIQGLAGSLRTPIMQTAQALTGWMQNIYGYIYEHDKLAAENEALRAQLAEAQEELRRALDANEENARLRELLNLREKHSDFVFESAKIVSWNTPNWTSSFTISKGERHGIKVGNCAVTEYGALVGQVVELGADWATVRSVIDVELSVGALVGEAGNAAMIIGDFALMHRGYTKLTHLTEGTQLLIGETILTSGKGGMFPQGLVIGKIALIETEAGIRYGVVEPSCNLDTVAQIFIVKEYDIVE